MPHSQSLGVGQYLMTLVTNDLNDLHNLICDIFRLRTIEKTFEYFLHFSLG